MARGSAACRAALCAAVLCSCLLAVRGGFVVEVGQLSVETPAGYGPYDMSVANFGRTIYGGQLRCAPFRARCCGRALRRTRGDPR